MAHIGVLKVLERAGMPIDIITGTSMGSIVGGLYACGNRAQRLDSVVRAQDWSYVLSDREDLSHQSLLERKKQNTYVISKSINFGRNMQVDGGLILGKNIMTLFDALTRHGGIEEGGKVAIPIVALTDELLGEALQSAIENDNYELAAVISNERNKRKQEREKNHPEEQNS